MERRKDDARGGVAAGEAALVVVVLILVSLFVTFNGTQVIERGVNIGDPAPPLIGPSHIGGSGEVWNDFDLFGEVIKPDWKEGDDDNFILIDFIDTDCPYCWNKAPEMSSIHTDYGSKLSMYSVVVSIEGLSGHESSQNEIIAFQEKSTVNGQSFMCKASATKCEERDGLAHPWTFIDDRDESNFNAWDVSGTPTYFILKPNGEIAWSSNSDGGLTLEQAIQTVAGA